MKLNDRQLGYAVLTGIFLVIAGISTWMVYKDLQAKFIIDIVYDELGSLQIQDPVKSKGFQVGQIIDIRWKNNQSIVRVRFTEPQVFHEGVVFKNENYSLMGARQITIVNNKNKPVLPPKPLYVGYFEPGIAETMHLITNLQQQMIQLKDILLVLQYGDSTQPALHKTIWAGIDAVDSATLQAEQIILSTEQQVHRLLNKLNSVSHDLISLTAITDTAMQNIIHTGGTLTDTLSVQISQMRNTLTIINTFLNTLQQETIYKELMEKKELLDKVAAFAAVLEKIVGFAASDGLYLTDTTGTQRSIVTLKNFHLFRKTAREKRAQTENSPK
jgi:ABC-type transporter Mla subunit MlaD